MNKLLRDQRHRVWLRLPLLLALTIAACSSRPANPSEESEFLQTQLIPEMIRWGTGTAEVMSLQGRLTPLSFDHICVVVEYQPLSVIEKEIPSINTYRGSVGQMVPETKIAVVGVKDDAAHVAYVSPRLLSIYGKTARCFVASNAVLRREPRQGTSIPWAVLEEAQ